MKNILLVEDSDDDIFILKRAARTAGVAAPVHVVHDGQQAVDYLSGRDDYSNREQYPLPCLILLDIKLPYKSGLEVIQWIRQQSAVSTLLVVFLTSSRHERDVSEAYRLGANAYLVKPPDTTRLAEMLKSVNEFWLIHNQSPPGIAGC